MTSLPDHYAALGIDPTADPEVITAAYRALAKKFHPDTGAAAGTASAERFDQVQQAYEVLRSPESRRAYDLELLAAAEAELAEHLAAKRRIVPHGAGEAPPPPPPDLGDIRPEPHQPPKPAAARRPGRSVLPFAIPLALVAGLGAAGAWVFLPQGPEAPPPPAVAKVDAVVPAPAATDPATPVPAKTDAASAQPPAAAPAPAPAAADPAPAPAAAPAEAEKPLFGSTATAALEPVTGEPNVPVPPEGVKDPSPPPPLAVPQSSPPPPVPKAKPAQAKPAPAKPAQPKPAQAKPAQPKQQPQPRVKLTYNDPPQYDPGYDPRYDDGDYPPPGLEPPPGFEPDGYPPPGYNPGRGRYRLVIFERQPGRQATAWSAGVVFKSFGKCTRQGVKAVLRRTGDMDPYADTRVWYECQRLSQR